MELSLQYCAVAGSKKSKMKFLNRAYGLRRHLETHWHLSTVWDVENQMLKHTVPYQNKCIENNKSSFDPKLTYDDICNKLEGLLDEYVSSRKERRRQYGWYTVYMKGVGRQYYNYLGRDGTRQRGYMVCNYFRFGFMLEGESPVILSCYLVRELDVKC